MPTLIWENDFSRARQELDQYLQQIQANPARVPVTFGGAGGAPSLPGTFGGSPLGGGTGPVVGAGSASMTTGGIQAAGQQVAQALASVANQIRAAGGVAPTLNGGGSIAPPYPGGATGGGLTAAAGGVSPVGGPGGWTQQDLNQLAAVNAAQQAGARTATARGGGSLLGGGISLYTGVELLRTADRLFTGDRLDKINSGYAGSLTERLEIERSGVQRRFQGLFGELAGAELDYTPLGRYVEGPREAQERLSQAIGTSRLRDRNRGLNLDIIAGDRNIAAGNGTIARQRAGIDNQYLAADSANDQDIIQSIIQSSNTALSPEGRAAAQTGLERQRRRSGQLYRQSLIDQQGVTNEVEDQLLDQAGRYGVATGQFNRTYGGRQRLAARAARAAPGSDDARLAGGDLQAYDAEEGFRNYERTTAARGSRDQAYYRFRDQPHVAEAIGIYNSGTAEYERAKREGSPEEADLVRQRTRYELLGYQRQLLESGSAEFSEGFAVDTGQAGSTGLQSKKEGDDLAEVLSKLGELLAAVNAVNDSLN